MWDILQVVFQLGYVFCKESKDKDIISMQRRENVKSLYTEAVVVIWIGSLPARNVAKHVMVTKRSKTCSGPFVTSMTDCFSKIVNG